MPLHPRTCSLLYSISCILDALDGYAARRYNQSTTFGAVLDMVTDRCTTSCLLVFLASAFPRWSIVFQGLISLDLASHYIHMYASLSMGGSGQSHKKVDESRSKILHLYYTNRVSSCALYPAISTLTSFATDCPVLVLRSQRTLLHCPLPALIFLTTPLALTTCFGRPSQPMLHHQRSDPSPTYQPSTPQAFFAVYESMVSWSDGDGKSEQDG